MGQEISSINSILAIVALRESGDSVQGGAPIILVDTREDLEEISMLLARITLGMVHELTDNIKIIIKH
ncbi:MAG: capping complex subunit for YIEGIA [Bacillota bacterium]